MKAVSVIVCTHNRAALLGRLVGSLTAQPAFAEWQPGCPHEIMIIDDGSTDKTPELCKEWAQRYVYLRSFRHSENKGLAAARNTGIREANNDDLLFVDDDCVAAPAWLEQLAGALEEHAIVAGSIETPFRPFFLLAFNVATFHPFLPGRRSGPAESLAGANFALRRSVCSRVGTFDESLTCAEDFEFLLRARSLGLSAWFESTAAVLHIPPRDSLSVLLRYAAAHASTTILLRQRFGTVMNTPRILRHPLPLALSTPFLAAGVTLKIFLSNRKAWRYLHIAPFVFASKMAWCAGACRSLMRQRKNAV